VHVTSDSGCWHIVLWRLLLTHSAHIANMIFLWRAVSASRYWTEFIDAQETEVNTKRRRVSTWNHARTAATAAGVTCEMVITSDPDGNLLEGHIALEQPPFGFFQVHTAAANGSRAHIGIVPYMPGSCAPLPPREAVPWCHTITKLPSMLHRAMFHWGENMRKGDDCCAHHIACSIALIDLGTHTIS
jgi:hypothetical protein